MTGCKGDELAAVQPRMRLDLPPGGFLRPAGTPAAESSAGGASSGCPGTLSGSTLFSEDIRRHTRELTRYPDDGTEFSRALGHLKAIPVTLMLFKKIQQQLFYYKLDLQTQAGLIILTNNRS